MIALFYLSLQILKLYSYIDIANDLSNFLIVVDLNPIFSTIPSIVPSTNIQSPILNLFSTKT